MIDAIPLLLAPEGYQISRSVRVRGSASAYFSRTLSASSTSTTTYTWSGWVKRGALGAARATVLYCGNTAGTGNMILIEFFSDALRVLFDGAGSTGLTTTAIYRDPSAWYHIVLAYDSTQATASNRARLYVNGTPITVFTVASYPALNQAILAGSGNIQNIALTSTNQFDGYYTELNLIDGYPTVASVTYNATTWAALNVATLFGETNPVTGVWQPKRYTGTYGTNGFYLNFSDNSGATATTIGKDYSGNGNNWTPNNISVTAGSTYDSMIDVPTQWADGGNGRGNYCTLNPLVASGLSGGGTINNGNLRVSGAAAVSNAYARGTMTLSGKFYAEFSFDVVNATASIGVDVVTATAGALNTSSTNVSYRSGGNRRVLGTETAYGASWVANDIIGVAVDTAANTVEFFKNGTSQGVITSSAFFAQGDCVFAMSKDDVGSPNGFANFGQRPFSYTPPTGFRALNTQNLPTPTILKGNQYFDATTYTANGGVQTVTNSGAMQPDLVWTKPRSAAFSNILNDSVRGAQLLLLTNTTGAEGTDANYLTAFNSNGFSLGTNNYANGTTMIGWQWKEGATQGFDIVTYTGNSTASRTIAHSLGVTPSMIIVKNRSAVQNWPVAHTSLAANNLLLLDTTNATISAGTRLLLGNSSTFTVGDAADYGITNQTSQNYVAYLFAAVAGFSRFGSYTGNGSATGDGPFVFCGFRPRWVMLKSSTVTGSWLIYDTSRNTANVMNLGLYPNTSGAQATETLNIIDTLSNGFKIRGAGGTDPAINSNGATIIYAAFAENPFKNALAR